MSEVADQIKTTIEVVDTLGGLDGFFDKLTSAATIVTDKLIEAAPDVAEAMLALVQFKGVFELATSLSIIVAVVVLNLVWGIKFYKWCGDNASGSDGASIFLATLVALASVTTCLFQIFDFLYVYNWLAVFYPEGAIALKALEAAGINL